MKPDKAKTRRQLGGELVIPVMAIAFTLYYFSTIWNSPWTAQVSAFLVGGVLLLVCGIFVLRCAIWLARGEGTLGVSNIVNMDDIRTGRIAGRCSSWPSTRASRAAGSKPRWRLC